MNLIWIPESSEIPNVEIMDMCDCASLVGPSSIEYCNKLTGLAHCKWDKSDNLVSFPTCLHFTSLQEVCLNSCPKLTEFPEVAQSKKQLSVGGTATDEFPSSIGNFSQLIHLDLRFCTRLKSLPSSIGQLKCPRSLTLSGCSKLASLPNSIYVLESLELDLLIVKILTDCQTIWEPVSHCMDFRCLKIPRKNSFIHQSWEKLDLASSNRFALSSVSTSNRLWYVSNFWQPRLFSVSERIRFVIQQFRAHTLKYQSWLYVFWIGVRGLNAYQSFQQIYNV